MTINKVLSGEYINTCCKVHDAMGCNGGHPEKAWNFIRKKGVCTGGEYNSKEVPTRIIYYYIMRVDLLFVLMNNFKLNFILKSRKKRTIEIYDYMYFIIYYAK